MKADSKKSTDTTKTKTRKLGDGFSLALNTGNDTHLTLVYFFKLKRGFEQDLVKQKAVQYFQDKNITNIALEFGGTHNERSIKVLGEIETVAKDLAELFSSFDIDKNQVPHIDLRGNRLENMSKNVSVVNNWYL